MYGIGPTVRLRELFHEHIRDNGFCLFYDAISTSERALRVRIEWVKLVYGIAQRNFVAFSSSLFQAQ